MERGRAEVVVVGAGLAGMATAARLQARGLSTIVLEAHGLPGGCAGYYRRAGFSFDVGATTLVDFTPDGENVRFLRRGFSQRPLWAVSLWQRGEGGVDFRRITVVVVDADTGDVTEVRRER